MTRVSNLAQLFCAFVFAAQVHATNLPPPLQPDKRSTVRPSPIVDDIPITCTTSAISIGCGKNACQSAWATAFTSSNAYVQSFCSSFTSPGRRNTLSFDKKGPAGACTKGLGNATIQSSISSVCSCYAGPGVPTTAFVTICPTCPPIQTQIVTTSVPTTTTIVRTADGIVKTVTTIITLVADQVLSNRITTTTTQFITRSDLSAPCTTTTNVLTTTLVTAIYDYFTYITTTYQAGRYPCDTTPWQSPSATTITVYTPYCDQISERIITITSTVTAGLPFLPPSPAICEPMTTTTVTLVIDPMPIEHTTTETITAGICTATTTETSTTTWDDNGFWPTPTPSTFSPIIIDDEGLTWRDSLVVSSQATSTSIQ
ncbi:uncharacterized protein Bfra_002316 [Botrytis fragariae]|uniref:Uncharacterized protein n=1 Tax=Botrytis fragariae TaxID=1964551 RepID=A0A8H6AYT8_9HELO|nr:uncharacterized protein Bfra_002316 [Botrytis fragariae]KAF5875920.1 hypothetical protein Bfra_002316 [Botrytis fragariae]